MDTRNWQFITKPAYRTLIVDLSARILISIFFVLNASFTSLLFMAFCHVILTVSTVFLSYRKKKALIAFLKLRLMSDKSNINASNTLNYSRTWIKIKTVKPQDDFFFLCLLIFIPILIASSFLAVMLKIPSDFSNGSLLGLFVGLIFILVFFSFFGVYYVFLKYLVSSNIISLDRDNEKIKKEELSEIITFLNREFNSDSKKWELSYVNDFIIADLGVKLKVYRERLENLSYESVFIGALTFATFIQLTSPENIDIIYRYNFLGKSDPSAEVGLPSLLEKFHQIVDGFWIEDSRFSLKNLFKLFSDSAKDKNESQPIGFIVIAIGSLLSSAFYVIVLLKRFAISKSIEYAQYSLEKGKIWNEREESLSKDDLRIKNRKLLFTDQIQIELSKTNNLIERVHSNLIIAELTRKIGLYMFFSVLLISSLLINKHLFYIITGATIYGMFASYIMNSSSNSNSRKITFKLC